MKAPKLMPRANERAQLYPGNFLYGKESLNDSHNKQIFRYYKVAAFGFLDSCRGSISIHKEEMFLSSRHNQARFQIRFNMNFVRPRQL